MVSNRGGSGDLSLGAGATVIPMSVACMLIRTADLPSPPAAQHIAINRHYLLMLYTLVAMLILTASAWMYNLSVSVYHLGLIFLGDVSGLALRFFRDDFAGLVMLHLILW